jgi:uncharacterized protein DUF397
MGEVGRDHAEVLPVVAAPSRERALVRDSKNPAGPVLAFTPDEWAAFLDEAKSGGFDLSGR